MPTLTIATLNGRTYDIEGDRLPNVRVLRMADGAVVASWRACDLGGPVLPDWPAERIEAKAALLAFIARQRTN